MTTQKKVIRDLYMNNIRFEPDYSGNHKYIAIIPQKGKRAKRVRFGSPQYEHFRDSVPKDLGGGVWSFLDHNDKDRRKAYRARHSKIKMKDGRLAYKVKYTPSYFSYWTL